MKGEKDDEDHLKRISDESFSQSAESVRSNTYTKDKRGSEFTYPQSSNKKANGRPLPPPSTMSIGGQTSNTGAALARKGTNNVNRQDQRNETVSDDDNAAMSYRENQMANPVVRGNAPFKAQPANSNVAIAT